MKRLAGLPFFIVSLLALLAAVHPLSFGQNEQQLAFAGLRAVAGKGQFNSVQVDSSGNLYLLFDQKDGVRILKTDPGATQVLAQVQLGTTGDIGIAMSLDPAGNAYVPGQQPRALSQPRQALLSPLPTTARPTPSSPSLTPA